MKLFLCEKPSQGRDIAAVLGATQRAEGCLSGNGIFVTWCIGHLREMAPPEAYGEQFKRWTLEDLPIIPSRWISQVKAGTRRQLSIVENLLARADEVVIATDADREGELIAWELLEHCRYRGSVQRLWLSALNAPSIRKALASLRPANETRPLYHAALARARADWLVGMNLSRLFTLLAQRAGHQGVLSIGRVQTPTLQLVAQRDRAIAAYKPHPYWQIRVACETQGGRFTAEWQPPSDSMDDAGRCVREIDAIRALAQLSRGTVVHVTDLKTDRLREPPPLPFDLSTLQEYGSSSLGLDVQHTLTLAQSLYETHKAITYPRSDCRHLPSNMHGEARSIVVALLDSDTGLNGACSHLDVNQRSRAWNDSKVTAHHAIIPTSEVPQRDRLTREEWGLYQLIRAAYLAQFLPNYEYDKTRVELLRGDIALCARGRKVLNVGWRSILEQAKESDQSDESDQEQQILPPLILNGTSTVTGAELRALKTVPPRHFTQGELVKAMKGIARWVSDPALKQKLRDTTGIGTEATRAHIIGALISRGYLQKQGRTIRATDVAHAVLQAIPPAVADPATTALWEQGLDQIAASQLTLETFVHEQSAWVESIVRKHREQPWTAPTLQPPVRSERGRTPTGTRASGLTSQRRRPTSARRRN